MRIAQKAALDRLVVLAVMVPCVGLGQTDGAVRYAPVHGLRIYCEEHGAGRPLVLLYGAFGAIETDFSEAFSAFAKTRRVIAIEQQGYGHTADIDRLLTFAQMADNVVDLLVRLKIDSGGP